MSNFETGKTQEIKEFVNFQTVEGNEQLVQVVADLFEVTIKPLYGDQANAIDKIRGGV